MATEEDRLIEEWMFPSEASYCGHISGRELAAMLFPEPYRKIAGTPEEQATEKRTLLRVTTWLDGMRIWLVYGFCQGLPFDATHNPNTGEPFPHDVTRQLVSELERIQNAYIQAKTPDADTFAKALPFIRSCVGVTRARPCNGEEVLVHRMFQILCQIREAYNDEPPYRSEQEQTEKGMARAAELEAEMAEEAAKRNSSS